MHLVVLILSGGSDQATLIPPGVVIPPVLMVQIPPGGSDEVISGLSLTGHCIRAGGVHHQRGVDAE